ncbi:MAG: hypothetical protein GF368_03890 [Candidatus Aenigmarchaeota archaeon]|nr:hypothetical protein [Candidatus Aenigmarchaeota archaeon]
MKRLLILFTVLILLLGVRAAPVIQGFSIDPDEIWMENGETSDVPIISITRSDNETGVRCFSNITAPDGTIFRDLSLIEISPKYHEIEQDTLAEYLQILNLEGVYYVVVFCNKNQISNVESGSFSIYDIETTIEVSPNPSYLGEDIEIIFNLKENGRIKKEGLENFKISIDGEDWNFIPGNPVYIPSKDGYFLEIEDLIKGRHDLEVNADYRGKKVSNLFEINVEDPVQFEITNLDDRTEVKPNENITIRVRAFDKNNDNFRLKKEYLEIEISSDYVDSDYFSISKEGSDYYDIDLKPPSHSGGEKSLKVSFDYNNFPIIEETRKLFYVIPISGRILNYNDDPLNAEFSFSSNYFNKKIKTSNNGSYFDYMCPGTYYTSIKFPHTDLELENLKLDKDEFSDPFSYNFFDEFDLGGIRAASLYFLEISPSFSKGSLNMYYNPQYISNEDNLKVYKCDNWDEGDRKCDDIWEEIDFEQDKKSNEVNIKPSNEAAYAIGNRKFLDPSFSLNKDVYYLDDIVNIQGVIRDDIHDPVGNASVDIRLEGTSKDIQIKSASNGIVSVTMSSPNKEGNYTLSINVEKDPYDDFNSKIKLVVDEKEEISLVTPEAVRVEQGETSSIEISVVNIGQSDLSDIEFSIEGLPENYYSFTEKIPYLEKEEEKKVKIDFSVPEDVSEGTFNGKFKIEFDGRIKEEIFGFTVLKKIQKEGEDDQNQESDTSSTTGKFVLPEISLPSLQFLHKLLYIIPFMAISFAGAFLLKKGKKKSSKNESKIKETFSEIKSQIRGKKEDDSEEN